MTQTKKLTEYDRMYIDAKLGQKIRKNSVKCHHCDYVFLLDERNYNFNMVMEHTKRRHPEIYLEAMINYERSK